MESEERRMSEYIVEKKQTSGGWTWAEPKGELIRCKECIHNGEHGDCPALGWDRTETDYCSWAERKGE